MKAREYIVTFKAIHPDGKCFGFQEFTTADSFSDAIFTVINDLEMLHSVDHGICRLQDALLIFNEGRLYTFYYDFCVQYAD